MKNIKRILTATVAMLMVFSFTACKDDDSSSASKVTTNKTKITTAPIATDDQSTTNTDQTTAAITEAENENGLKVYATFRL